MDKLSHVTWRALKCYDCFGLLHHDTIGLWLAQVSEVYLNTLQSRNVAVKSVGAKVDIREKYTLSFLHKELII